VTGELLHACESAIDSDIAAAESLLTQASELQPAYSLLTPLKTRIYQVRHLEKVDGFLVKAARLRKAGDLPAALREIEQALCEDPENDRLLQVQSEVEKQIQNLEEDAKCRQQLERDRLRQAKLSRQRILDRQKREAAVAQARSEEEEKERARVNQAEPDRERFKAQIIEVDSPAQGTEQISGAGTGTQIFDGNRPRPVGSSLSAHSGLTQVSVLRKRLDPLPAGRAPSTARVAAPKWQYLTGISLAVILLISIEVWLRNNATSKVVNHPTFRVQITTTPTSATVRIRNTDWTCITPKCIVSLGVGDYEAVAELPGYETTTQPFSVGSSGANSFSISLPQKPTRLEVHGLKSAVEIVIDGRPQGQASPDGNFSKELAAGSHEIEWVGNDNTSGITFRRIPAGETVTVSSKDFNPVGSRDPSEIAWQQIQGANSIPDFEGYLTLYPKSAHKAELESSLDKLYWQNAEASSQVEDVETYLRRFPKGSNRLQAEIKREQLYWQIAKSHKSAADLQKYLRLFRDGPHFAEASAILEEIDWQRARDANTIAAFNDYLTKYRAGQHAAEATQEIDELDFRAIENSENITALEDYLTMHKSGPYHDRIDSRLDDMTWSTTNKQDSLSLHAYLQRFPNGRHVAEANKDIGALSSQEEVQAIKAAIERYRDAYESESPADIRAAWPGISKEQLKKMTELFNTFSAIKMRITCRDTDLQIAGQQAVEVCHQSARFTQRGTVMPEQPSDVKIVLKKLSDGIWVIESVVNK